MRGNHIQPLTIDEAQQQLVALINPVSESNLDSPSTELVPVGASLGRIVAEDTSSPVPVPGFANSAMDGYAVKHSDLSASGATTLVVQGESLAGHPFHDPLLPGHSIRIFTGAALPEGADTVVIQENCSLLTDPVSASTKEVTINESPAFGAYTRGVGHDVPKDSLLLAKGTRMRAFEIASATTSGLTHINVIRRLRIGVFATGDELRKPGDSLEPGQIYESNRIAIISLLGELPLEITNLGILPDDLDATRDALTAASETQDALITSGGVSVGDADFVRTAIEDLGAIDFWRLNLRPGKPFAFGHLKTDHLPQPKPQPKSQPKNDRCLIFGLPGNPVSTIVTLLLLVKPALWHMAGSEALRQNPVRVPLAQDVSHSQGRHEYQRGELKAGDSGTVVATTSDQSSNRLQSFAGSNCLFLLPGEVSALRAGDLVEVLPFEGLTG